MFGPVARVSILAAILTVVLSGCYLPLRFDAEIELSKRGYYSIIFDGYLAWVPFFDKLKKGELSKEQEKKESEKILTDLTRDSATKEVKYFKNGVFKVNWQKSGDLFRSPMITFVRRNAVLFSISYVKDSDQVTLRGTMVKQNDAKRLTEMGLGIDGELRVKTDGRVVDHNAAKETKVPGTNQKLYVWKVKSLFEQAPKLVMVLR